MYASLKIYRVLLDVFGGFVCAASIHPSAGGHHIKVCPEQTQLRHLSSSLGADQRREDEGSANLHKLYNLGGNEEVVPPHAVPVFSNS